MSTGGLQDPMSLEGLPLLVRRLPKDSVEEHRLVVLPVLTLTGSMDEGQRMSVFGLLGRAQ